MSGEKERNWGEKRGKFGRVKKGGGFIFQGPAGGARPINRSLFVERLMEVEDGKGENRAEQTSPKDCRIKGNRKSIRRSP